MFVEHKGFGIGGPYWITETIINGTRRTSHFHNLKDVPGDEGKVKECMPELWLKTTPNFKDPSVEADESFDMHDARKRSQMMREMVLRKPKRVGELGTIPMLSIEAQAFKSAVQDREQEQVPKAETEEKEPAVGSSEQGQVPETETEKNAPAIRLRSKPRQARSFQRPL